MTPRWYTIDPASAPRGAVVGEATAAARPFWQGPVISVLLDCKEKLPPGRWPDVAFLGGRVSHPLADVLRGLAAADDLPPGDAVVIEKQFPRGPVIGPWLREQDGKPPRPVVVVTNGPILDLDDWATPDVLRTVRIYRLTGPDRVSPPAWTEWPPETDPDSIPEFLADKLTTVTVGASGGVVLGWADAEVTWSAGRLRGPAPAAAFRVLFAHPDDAPPAAAGTRAAGGDVTLAVTPCSDPPADPPPLPLTPAEETVFRMWQRGSGFYCGTCGATHPPGRVRCATGGGGVLPTLAAGVTYLVHAGVAQPVPGGVVLLADGRVLASDPPRAYAPTDAGGWDASGDPLPPLPEAAGGATVVRG